MKRYAISIALAAAAVLPPSPAAATVAGDDEPRAAVERVFADYLASLDPIGEAFVAPACAPVDAEAEIWNCYAIDEGVVSASLELPLGDGDPFVFYAEHYSPGTGTPLPGTVITPAE